jgi:hypothetical protein
MRPTMRLRVRLWCWIIDRIVANKSPRWGFWALRAVDWWDKHMNLWAPPAKKGDA